MVIILNIFRYSWNAETQRRRDFTSSALRLCVSAFLFFSFSPLIFSQDWNWVQVVSSNGEMDLTSMTVDSRDNTYISGIFTESFTLLDATYPSNGLADNYVMKLTSSGEVDWVLTGGSEGNDTDSGICVDETGALYWVGGFWLNGQYGELNLTSTKSSKSIFFIKYDTEGEIVWSKLIEGTNTKNSGPPTLDKEGNVYIAGSFADSLFVDQQVFVARAEEDSFVSKWNTDGQLIWLTHFGEEGLNRASEVIINTNKEVIVGGSFKGIIAFPKDTITANTPDFDVFVATLKENGQPLWLRKAGGVLEDSFSSITLDQTDNIYIVGQYTGRLALNEEIEITTEGFNENGFLLTYNSSGQPLLATSIGGPTFETCTDILLNEELFISGFFDQQLLVQDQQISGAGELSGYLLTLDTLSSVNMLREFSSDNLLLINQLANISSNNIAIGGTFKGNVLFQQQPFMSPEHFSVFVGNYNVNQTTPTITIDPSFYFHIYPNPSSDLLHIQTSLPAYHIRLWNQQGQLVMQEASIPFLKTAFLPDGIYFLELSSSTSPVVTKKIIINH